MGITTFSSRDFNQATSKAKQAADKGPVFITDRGEKAHVLLTIDEYQRITNEKKSIIELLTMPGLADIDFEAPRLDEKLARTADLS